MNLWIVRTRYGKLLFGPFRTKQAAIRCARFHNYKWHKRSLYVVAFGK